MTIETLARREVITASPDESAGELAATMRDENVGSVVITDGDTPVGIVTDRDLTVEVLADGTDPDDATAADLMADELRTIPSDAGFYEATELMSRHGIRRMPVTDDDRLVGIITADDLSELLADEQQELAGVVRAQRQPY